MQIKENVLKLYSSLERGSLGGGISPLHTNPRSNLKEIKTFLGSEEAFLGSFFARGMYLKNVSQNLVRNVSLNLDGGRVTSQEVVRADNPFDFNLAEPSLLVKNTEDLFWRVSNNLEESVYRLFFRRFLEREIPFLPILEGSKYDYIDYTYRDIEVSEEELDFYKNIYPDYTSSEILASAQSGKRDYLKFSKWFYTEILSTAITRASLFGQIQPMLGFYKSSNLPIFDTKGFTSLGVDVKKNLETSLNILRPRQFAPLVFSIAANFNPFWGLEKDFSAVWFSWEEKLGVEWVAYRTPIIQIVTQSNFEVITAYNSDMLESLYAFYPPFFKYYLD